MLWYKSWLETRWRFLIGLAVLLCSAAATVLAYPEVIKALASVQTDAKGEIGRRIKEAADLARDYRGYIWSSWFRDSLTKFWTLFAILLGTGGSITQPSGGAALFTLSLPVSRARTLGIRIATGTAELFVLAFVPSLLIPILSPAIGQTYSISSTLIHSALLFIGGSLFFSMATVISTEFSDVWRPMLITFSGWFALGIFERTFHFGVFRVMSGESYFRNGDVPWAGLLVVTALSAGMQYGAAMNIAHRDF